MGLQCALAPAAKVRYAVEVGGGLVEREIVHLFTGVCNKRPYPDPEEVSEWRWIDRQSLKRDTRERPYAFTAWFDVVLAGLEAAPPCPGVLAISRWSASVAPSLRHP
jgi:isopentenyl-diphosphate delta-isomerase